MGEGAVGEVYQVVHKKTLELFALKRVNKITAQMVSIKTYDSIHFMLTSIHLITTILPGSLSIIKIQK